MQIEETVISNSAAAKVVSMDDYGSRRLKSRDGESRPRMISLHHLMK